MRTWARVSRLKHEEARSGQHVIPVRRYLAGNAGNRFGGLNCSVPMLREGIDQRRHEHVSRHPAEKIEMEVLHPLSLDRIFVHGVIVRPQTACASSQILKI